MLSAVDEAEAHKQYGRRRLWDDRACRLADSGTSILAHGGFNTD